MPLCALCQDTDVVLHPASKEFDWGQVETPCPVCEFKRLNAKLALANYATFARCPFTNRMLFTIGKVCEVASVMGLRDVDWNKPEVVAFVSGAHRAAHREYLRRHRWSDLWFALQCGLLFGVLRGAVLLIWNV